MSSNAHKTATKLAFVACMRRGTFTRDKISTLSSAMTSTPAIASDADDQVDPHSNANWTIDFVSRSMKPTPRKKKCTELRPKLGSALLRAESVTASETNDRQST